MSGSRIQLQVLAIVVAALVVALLVQSAWALGHRGSDGPPVDCFGRTLLSTVQYARYTPEGGKTCWVAQPSTSLGVFSGR